MLLGAALYASSIRRTPPMLRTLARPFGSCTSLRRLAAARRSTPHTFATAIASPADRANCAPKSGRSIWSRSSSTRSSTRVRAVSWSSSTLMMRTSAPSASPAVRTRAGPRAASRITRASSAARIAQPSAGRAAMSSPFADSIASSPPARSACTASIAVTTPMRGRAIAQRALISPPTYIPISATKRSVASGRLSSASGRPISLFAFPGVAATRSLSPPSAL